MPDSQSLPDHSAAAVWGDGTPTLAEAERARTEALQAENDRLRAALEETAGAFSAWSGARRDAMKYGGSSAREYDRLVRAMIAAWLGDDCPHRDREDGSYCGAPMNRCAEDNRLELVGARCDVETVERLRQSYEGQVDGMSNIERRTARGTRAADRELRAELVPPLRERSGALATRRTSSLPATTSRGPCQRLSASATGTWTRWMISRSTSPTSYARSRSKSSGLVPPPSGGSEVWSHLPVRSLIGLQRDAAVAQMGEEARALLAAGYAVDADRVLDGIADRIRSWEEEG
jgi:hypothetical protein